ncbi:PCRF domain-containing protein [Sphingorhabdus contaminans]|uniref:PCRF domain-containing protein n=1 Tax=Sphingorhabdus contaminans TaxID=1343899 RepID=A0A553WCG3_9SPHN|nr:PCRF domain-containing protein [Sphingorhabdus contaminans]TSB02374.1 PCRF domain-containing protein [Sphingorhabdus contaminans]
MESRRGGPVIEQPVIIDIGYIIGGEEGHLLVHALLGMFSAYAEKTGLIHDVMERAPVFGGGLKSAKLGIYCVDGDQFASMHQGTHTLIRVPPNASPQRRHMSCAGVRVSGCNNLPLPLEMADWGEERRRYILDPYRAIIDARRGKLDIDPDIVFAGDFSGIA